MAGRSNRRRYRVEALAFYSLFRFTQQNLTSLTQRLLSVPPRIETILIVDDDSVTCELLCEVFEREGFVTRFAQSSEAALSLMKSLEVDVLVSDIHMKTKLDGLSLLEQV